MKIVFAVESLSEFGGIQKSIIHLATIFSKHYEVSLWTFDSDEATLFFDVPHSVSVLKMGSMFEDMQKHLWYFPRMVRRICFLKGIVRNEKPDVVISFVDLMNIQYIGAKSGGDFSLLICERNNPIFRPLPLLWHVVREIVYPWADRFIVQTEGVKEKYSKRLQKNMRVISNPIYKVAESVPDGIRHNEIIAVGRLREAKGFHDLIHAFSKVQCEDWKLTLIGDGPLKKSIEELILKLGIADNVHLEGAVADVSPYYKRARIFVLSSHWEGFPNVLGEAMSHGLACIASHCEFGPETLLAEEAGILYPVGDVNQLAVALKKLMGDRALQEKLALKAKQRSLLFSADNIFSCWDKIIKEVQTYATC